MDTYMKGTRKEILPGEFMHNSFKDREGFGWAVGRWEETAAAF